MPDTDVFSALASPVRRSILALLLADGAQPVHAIAAHFVMARPSVSEHLRLLLDVGLVSEERVGRERRYRLRAEPLAKVADWLSPYEQFWRGRLRGLAELLDDPAFDEAGSDAGESSDG